MADFCLATGIQPSEYKLLTLIEYIEFVKILNKAAERQ